MDQKTLVDWVLNQGPVVAILVFMIYFGYKHFTTFISRLHIENQEAWKKATQERESRFQEMQSRFESSDRRHEICEKDRARMQEQFIEFLLEKKKSTVFIPDDQKTLP